MNSRLAEAIDGIEVVKGAAQEPQEIERFTGDARRFRQAYVRQGHVEARFLPLLLLGVAAAAAFLQAILLYSRGEIDLGQVIAYVGLVNLFGFPTFVSLFAYSQVSLGMASARRILELVNRRTELDQNIGGHAGPMRGEIEFCGVDFGHAEAEGGLRELSFHVERGQTVAIVGQTGAGKTTLAKLVNRTYDAAAGQVLVDGIDVRRWDLASLRGQISMIEQDVFLFSRTIAENIAFGKPGATQAEIEQAARAAQAHDFVLGFSDGYRTLVGERGVTLSGGQRQRLALARAFLTDPRILILDDSTSSIDSATEDEIQQAIFRAARGRTTLIITHRLSQIRWADRILVLRQGRLAAAGSHQELMRSAPAYRRIFEQWGTARWFLRRPRRRELRSDLRRRASGARMWSYFKPHRRKLDGSVWRSWRCRSPRRRATDLGRVQGCPGQVTRRPRAGSGALPPGFHRLGANGSRRLSAEAVGDVMLACGPTPSAPPSATTWPSSASMPPDGSSAASPPTPRSSLRSWFC
jgi:ATP-binding cassette subfamily B protein